MDLIETGEIKYDEEHLKFVNSTYWDNCGKLSTEQHAFKIFIILMQPHHNIFREWSATNSYPDTYFPTFCQNFWYTSWWCCCNCDELCKAEEVSYKPDDCCCNSPMTYKKFGKKILREIGNKHTRIPQSISIGNFIPRYFRYTSVSMNELENLIPIMNSTYILAKDIATRNLKRIDNRTKFFHEALTTATNYTFKDDKLATLDFASIQQAKIKDIETAMNQHMDKHLSAMHDKITFLAEEIEKIKGPEDQEMSLI